MIKILSVSLLTLMLSMFLATSSFAEEDVQAPLIKMYKSPG